MRKFQEKDLGGCFVEDTRYNDSFGILIARHPCEVPIEDGVYVDEENWEPVARLDGRTDSLFAAANPKVDDIWREQEEEQQAEQDAMMHHICAVIREVEESDLPSFFTTTNMGDPIRVVPDELDLLFAEGLHSHQDGYSDERKEHDPQELFPAPIKPTQTFFSKKQNGGQYRNSSKRNCGRKVILRKNNRETIRRIQIEME